MDERAWWNEFGHLNEQVWQYNPELSRIVRSDYLAELETFLFKPDGRVLDIGCGHGWVGLRLAQRGMHLDGLDLSDAQIEEARRRAAESGLPNVRFWRADARTLERHGQYDSVIVHALLHHLDRDSQVGLLKSIADLLTEGGRVYLYEPLAPAPDPPLAVVVFDKALGGFMRGLTFTARVAGIMAPQFSAAQRRGWSMRSSDEAPIHLDNLLAARPDTLKVVSITTWQAYSIMYANLCMMLRQPWQRWAGRLAPVFYRLDRLVLSRPWHRYLRGWPMAGIALEKQRSEADTPPT
ncbi:MAG: SAM-dependent methyltransferase [Anaerolineae bacterium]